MALLWTVSYFIYISLWKGDFLPSTSFDKLLANWAFKVDDVRREDECQVLSLGLKGA